MEEIIEEEKKPSQKTRIPLFVIATLAIIIVAFVSMFIWSINFKEIVDSASESGDGGAVFGAVLAIILLSLPFLGGALIIVVLSAVFAPLSFALLTKSSAKAISIMGIIYGTLFSLAFVATIIRVVLYLIAIA